MRQERFNVGGACVPVHRHDRDQHQHRAEQRVQEELVGCIDPACTAPHTDDQEHRNEASFEEHVEHDQVQRAEDADHQRFQNEEGNHVFLYPLLHAVPGGQDAERHQEGREDHEEDGNTVNAHAVADVASKPFPVFHELEAGIGVVEIAPDEQRQKEGHRGGHKSDHPDVLLAALVIPRNQENEEHAQQRQERRE